MIARPRNNASTKTAIDSSLVYSDACKEENTFVVRTKIWVVFPVRILITVQMNDNQRGTFLMKIWVVQWKLVQQKVVSLARTTNIRRFVGWRILESFGSSRYFQGLEIFGIWTWVPIEPE